MLRIFAALEDYLILFYVRNVQRNVEESIVNAPLVSKRKI
jgi:hypothetical protein